MKFKDITEEKKIKKLSAKQVEEKFNDKSIYPDEITLKSGIYTIREGFFYRHGKTTKDLLNKVKSVFPNATIIDSGEIYTAFNGGAKISKQSHWFVKFTLPDEN